MVVHRVLVDPIRHGFTPAMDHQAHIDPPILEPYLHVQIVPTVPDAQSAPNAVFRDGCQTHFSMVDPPYEIPLTQNHPSVLTAWELTPFLTSISFILSSFL